ncbi:hypothetical protein ACHAXR_007844 [Thalassiosira sp. AJA248-18]
MVLPNKHKIGTVVAAIFAVSVGLLILLFPSSIGLLPALTSRPWSYTFEQLHKSDLRGQVALVTGANSGIGFEISRALSRQGASVTMACRNPQRCFAAADRIRKEDGYSGAPIAPLIIDVSDLTSVQRAAKSFIQHNEHQQVDMLFLNAGIFYDDYAAATTELPQSIDGIEKVFATNVVGHHLLYRLLEPALQNSTMARVIHTSSIASIWWLPPYGLAYRFGDKSPLIPATLEELNAGKPSYMQRHALYGRSKLAQVAWSKALARRLGNQSNIYVNVAHPGAVQSPMTMGKNFPPFLPQFFTNAIVYLEKQLLWTAAEGALTQLYLGVATNDIGRKNIRGKFFHPQAVEFVDHPHAEDEELQENVWKLCEDLVTGFIS